MKSCINCGKALSGRQRLACASSICRRAAKRLRDTDARVRQTPGFYVLEDLGLTRGQTTDPAHRADIEAAVARLSESEVLDKLEKLGQVRGIEIAADAGDWLQVSRMPRSDRPVGKEEGARPTRYGDANPVAAEFLAEGGWVKDDDELGRYGTEYAVGEWTVGLPKPWGRSVKDTPVMPDPGPGAVGSYVYDDPAVAGRVPFKTPWDLVFAADYGLEFEEPQGSDILTIVGRDVMSCTECDKEWKGFGIRHCRGCHESFESNSAFDRHKDRNRCRDGLEMQLDEALTPGDGGVWRCLRLPDHHWRIEAERALGASSSAVAASSSRVRKPHVEKSRDGIGRRDDQPEAA